MIEVTYNVIDPALMTEHERHQEVAQILAHGIIRLCAQATEEIAQKSQIQLAMPATKSVHTVPKTAVRKGVK
jgi:hypothetical protein